MKLERRLSKLQKILVGVVMSIVSGIWALMTGFLDPTWLMAHSEAWWGIGSMFSRFIGPMVIPDLSWSAITLVLALMSISVMLYRLGKGKEVGG